MNKINTEDFNQVSDSKYERGGRIFKKNSVTGSRKRENKKNQDDSVVSN